MNPAFAYLYGAFLSDGRYERDVGALETELARRGVEGRVVRLSMFRVAKEAIEDALGQGASNLVVVGDDRTFQSALPTLLEQGATVGYVPMEKASVIGQALGIPRGAAAAETVAARRMETLDVGVCGGRPFFVDVQVPAGRVTLDVEGKYRLSSEEATLSVKNLTGASASDGWLDATITPARHATLTERWFKRAVTEETRVRLQEGSIQFAGQGIALIDGEAYEGGSFPLGILPARLRCIVGRRA